ncbi:CapA family protein [Saccharibacillus sp. VR-M41]|uniref:CapA family protein n=2 Tax=Saccharibacillus alkalitolerans TaxID=2705290 RepID=A0ABX0F5J9_9BACL|nr:CapA family protein [Saccharibacillus alkalitolerans]
MLILVAAGGALIYAREHTAREASTAAALRAAAEQTEAAIAYAAGSDAFEPAVSEPAAPQEPAAAGEEPAAPAAPDAAGGETPSGDASQPDEDLPADDAAGDAPQAGAEADSARPNPPLTAGAAVGAAPPAAGAAAAKPPANPGGGQPESEASGQAEASASEEPAGTRSPAPEAAEPPKKAASSGAGGPVVNLTFAGDVIFSGKVQSVLEQQGYDYPYTYVRNRFKSDDLTVINLETPVTSGNTTGADKTFVFKSPPEALAPLKDAGVDVVNLANNHTLDQGIPGLLDTIANLDKNGIAHVGAGKNASAAYAPVYVERKGVKIAIVGVSRVLPETSWAAGPNHPGAASAYDPEAAARAVEEAKRNADVVVAVVHWGKERVDMPDGNQTTLARRMIDAGADLIIGGHAHVLQGFEQYKGKWIAYGTGNFIFTRSATAKTWETGVFQAECRKDGTCSLKLVPYWAELARPVPMDQADAQRLLRRIEKLSPGVKIDADGRVRAN